MQAHTYKYKWHCARTSGDKQGKQERAGGASSTNQWGQAWMRTIKDKQARTSTDEQEKHEGVWTGKNKQERAGAGTSTDEQRQPWTSTNERGKHERATSRSRYQHGQAETSTNKHEQAGTSTDKWGQAGKTWTSGDMHERERTSRSGYQYLIFSSIYRDLIMILNYFNEKKLQVPKVPRVSLDTVWITVRYGSYPPRVMMYTGTGVVWENPTCGIPVRNPTGLIYARNGSLQQVCLLNPQTVRKCHGHCQWCSE